MTGHPFVVAHRGASADRPEHTVAAYELALQEGADGVECDVRLTRDGHLVCVHDRRVDRTSDGSGLVSEMTLAQLRELDFGSWHAGWRDSGATGDTGLLTLDTLLALVLDAKRPVKIFIETKHPVRYGALVESKVLALLHRYGIAGPASADLARAVVMSFSAAAVWRIRRAAPMLPTVLLGETSRYLGRRRDDGRGDRGGPVHRHLARTSGTGRSRRRAGSGAVLLDRRPLRGRAVLPRPRGGVDRDESPWPHQGLAAERADRRGPRLTPLRVRGVEHVLRDRGVGGQGREQLLGGVAVPHDDRA